MYTVPRIPQNSCPQNSQGIATALGISVSTAHEFVEKAKRKLKAKSRAELIAVAVSLAFIDL